MRCILAVLLLLVAPTVEAREVTFRVYPPDAVVKREAATASHTAELGRANRPLARADVLGDRGTVKIIISADGRRDWQRTFTRNDLPSGVFPPEGDIYLEPTSPVGRLADVPVRHPVLLGLGLLGCGLAGAGLSRKRRERRMELVLAALGAEEARTFGGYTLLERVGAGGMAEVYRAVPTLDFERAVRAGDASLAASSVVALKLMHPELCADQQAVERFRREIKVMRNLSHPGIVRIIDFGDVDGRVYLTMEYLEGESLAGLSRRPLEPSRALELLGPVCEALEFAHSRGVVHRDLSPGNVFVTRSGDVKVLDLGLARRGVETVQVTASGEALGTIGFTDPALFLGGQLRPWCDQYSVGALAYLLLTGRKAFDVSEQPDGLGLHAYLTQERPPAGLGPEVDRVLARMLALEPSRRFESLPEAYAALVRAAGSMSMGPFQVHRSA